MKNEMIDYDTTGFRAAKRETIDAFVKFVTDYLKPMAVKSLVNQVYDNLTPEEKLLVDIGVDEEKILKEKYSTFNDCLSNEMLNICLLLIASVI